VLEGFKKEFDDLQGFFWQPWNQAANYCLQNKFNLELALTWVSRSITINPNAQNQSTKILILEELGKRSEADKLKETAFNNATETDTAGYQFLTAGKTDEAIELFKLNTEKYPESWNVWDSLAEGFMIKGDKEQAIKYYSKALGMSPENQKARITQTIEKLKM
jgi:tetratricopeptide (TPR) repeat protein